MSAMASATLTLAPRLADRERVIRTIREHEAELRALEVAQLWLFGSLSRAGAGEASDIDVMIAIPHGRQFPLFDLGEVRVELCELLGRDVDVVTSRLSSAGIDRPISSGSSDDAPNVGRSRSAHARRDR